MISVFSVKTLMIKESTERNKHLSEMNNELFTC